MRRLLSIGAIVCLGCGLACLRSTRGQSASIAEWTTDSFDPERDGWQRDETKLTRENVKHLGLLWKIKTDNKPMGMQSFREPLILSGVNTSSGAKTLAILAGSSDNVYAIDADSGTLAWQKHLAWSSNRPQQRGEGWGFICTNALSATPVATVKGTDPRLVYVAT